MSGGQAARQRILLARAEIARDLIPDALRAAGAEVDVVDAYRNRLPEAARRLLKKALAKRIDAAMFTSSSSVTHLAAAAKQAGIAFPFAGVQAISIGPITTRRLRDMGWAPAAEATVSNIAGLIPGRCRGVLAKVSRAHTLYCDIRRDRRRSCLVRALLHAHSSR